MALVPVLGSVIVVVMTASFPVVLTGAMSVEMRQDIDFDNGSLGAAVLGYYVMSAALSTSCGRLTERVGSQQTLRVAAILGAVACTGIAFADRLAWLVVFLIVGGVAMPLAQPASNAVIMERVPHHRRGLAFGIKQSSVPGGTALAGLAVPIVGLTVGWRWAFAGAAVMCLVAAATVPESAQRPRRSRSSDDVLRGSYGELVVLAAAAALGAAPSMSLPVFLTASATGRGFSSAAAGALLTVGSIGGLAVRLLVGARADRRSGGHLRPIAGLMALGGLGLVGMTIDHPVAFTAATMLAFGAAWAWQGLFNHAVANRWASSPAAATGVTQTGIFAGGIIGPLTFGLLTSRWSDDAGWLVLSVMITTAMCLVLAVRRWSAPTVPALGTLGGQ
jgi:MFS family permease